MIWNYRVMKRDFGDEVEQYDLVEAYYDDNDYADDALPHSWTERASGASGSSPEEVREDLELMIADAFSKPVLDEAECLRAIGVETP